VSNHFVPDTCPIPILSRPPMIPSSPFGRTSWLFGYIDVRHICKMVTAQQTWIIPSESHFSTIAQELQNSFWLSERCRFPLVWTALHPLPSSSLTDAGRIHTRTPFRASNLHPTDFVSGSEIASKTILIGLSITLLMAATSWLPERCQSKKWLRCSSWQGLHC